MKKSTINAIVSYIDTNAIAELADVRAELAAELTKGEAKADANRALYAEIHDKVIAVLADATNPVTAQEIADETGCPKGKIVYGLRNYWGDEVAKIEGKVNTYTLKA